MLFVIHRSRIAVNIAPHSLFGRLIAALIVVSLAVLAVFFFVAFVIGFVLVCAALIVRVIWLGGRARRRASRRVFDAEFSTESDKHLGGPAESVPGAEDIPGKLTK